MKSLRERAEEIAFETGAAEFDSEQRDQLIQAIKKALIKAEREGFKKAILKASNRPFYLGQRPVDIRQSILNLLPKKEEK